MGLGACLRSLQQWCKDMDPERDSRDGHYAGQLLWAGGSAMGLSTDEAVKNLGELKGPLPDAAAREKRLRQAADVLLDHIDRQPIRDAYHEALRGDPVRSA